MAHDYAWLNQLVANHRLICRPQTVTIINEHKKDCVVSDLFIVSLNIFHTARTWFVPVVCFRSVPNVNIENISTLYTSFHTCHSVDEVVFSDTIYSLPTRN